MSEPRTPHLFAENFPWERLAKPVLTGKQLADKGHRALRRVAEWGIGLPANNRLARATEMVGRGRGQTLPETAIAGEAARTILDFYLATHAQDERPSATMTDKLIEAVGGGDTNATDGDRGVRDTQFELVVWGMLRIGGFPCWFEEPPDLVLGLRDEEFGVAVKRVWNPEQAHKRLSIGAEQIERCGRRGIIATNIQEYLSLESLGPSQAAVRDMGKAFDIDVQRMHGQLPYLAGKPHVVGHLLVGSGFQRRAEESMDQQVVDLTSYTQLWGLEKEVEAAGSLSELQALGAALRHWYHEWL